MANVDRFMLPQEFYDWTSEKLLIQPEPQYTFAQMMLKAWGASLVVPGAVGLPGREVTYGAADYGSALDDRLNLEPDIISDNLFGVKIDFNGQPGTTVRINRPKYTDSTYTEASRRVVPGASISTTGIALSSEQAIVTLQRYAGPYSSAIQPYVIERPMAMGGVHDLVKVAGRHLVRDFHKFLDAQGVALGMTGATTIYPVGMTAANDATTTASFPLTYEQLNRTAKYMDEDLKLPTLPDGRRVLVLTPTGEKQLQDDPQYARYAHDFEKTNPLFRRYTNLKAVSQNWYIFTSTTLDITANASSVNVHTGLALAPGAFGLGMGTSPVIRNSTNDNYGLSVPVIWEACLGFATLDSRFAVKVVYSQDVN